ncbi:hypothetical protein TWF970_010639 [Orbilia oligospora]|uniref:Uncharacterized protein n=1 Tax=Orbilia oligospora TaxID=2813651 RepID=A0A7C8VG91_ORBOL|nr:hypothetical protein TWF970_010639 [Orbilia oligospora]
MLWGFSNAEHTSTIDPHAEQCTSLALPSINGMYIPIAQTGPARQSNMQQPPAHPNIRLFESTSEANMQCQHAIPCRHTIIPRAIYLWPLEFILSDEFSEIPQHPLREIIASELLRSM